MPRKEEDLEDFGGEKERRAWERREKGEKFPTSNPRERKRKHYEDIGPQKHLNTPLT